MIYAGEHVRPAAIPHVRACDCCGRDSTTRAPVNSASFFCGKCSHGEHVERAVIVNNVRADPDEYVLVPDDVPSE